MYAWSEQQRNGEDDAERAAVQRLLDIVGGAASELAVLAADLPDLREGGFDECGCGGDGGHDPHPEDRARPADGDGRGDAGDVTRADAGGGGDHQGLERGNALLAGHMLALREMPDHVFEPAELDELRADGEVQSGEDEEEYQEVRVHIRIDGIRYGDECVHGRPFLYACGCASRRHAPTVT